MYSTVNSEKLFEKAKTLMPGGVNSPVRAFGAVGGTPRFIKSAHGDRIIDADGNEYIDYVCSWGPGIIGHAHPRVIEAVTAVCRDGLTFGAPTERESVLAEMIIDAVPSIEMVRLVSSGTEAAMSAVRAARGITGRDLVMKFEGCYHGHSDGLLVKAGSGALTAAKPDSAGVPRGYTDNTLVAQFNDFDNVRALFEKYGNKIACVITEPVAANMGVVPPAEGFLQFLRDITREYGALLIFDEVITGFRLAYGGAQGFYGVTPDITALGKIVGGGMPLAAYGGRRDIMECIAPLGGVYQAGTLSGNPVAVTAGIATLEILRSDLGIYERIDKKAERLACAYAGFEGVTVNRVGSLLSAFFTDEAVTRYKSAARSDKARFAEYFNHMIRSGLYIAPSQFEAVFVSDAHTDADIDATVAAVKNALERTVSCV